MLTIAIEVVVVTTYLHIILTLQVDAIVNSTDCRLQLNRGASSRALLQIGGTLLQTACQMVAPDGIEYGEVVTTGGGQLKCKLVMHGACCSWDSGVGRSQHVNYLATQYV